MSIRRPRRRQCTRTLAGALALPLILPLALLPAVGCSTPPELLTHREGGEEGEPAPLRPVIQGVPVPADFAEPARWAERLGPGDVLRVNVFDHPQLSSPPYRQGIQGSPVQGDGSVQLPLVGEIPVAGLTPSQVRLAVEEALQPYLKAPRVDVAVVEYASQRVFVFGAVDLPGAYALSRPTNVLEALSFAGGFDQFANRRQVAWLRAGSLAAGEVDEEDALVIVNANEVDLLLAAQVQPGDLLFVGRRDWADLSEAARDVIPILQTVSIPLSLGLQAATLERIR